MLNSFIFKLQRKWKCEIYFMYEELPDIYIITVKTKSNKYGERFKFSQAYPAEQLSHMSKDCKSFDEFLFELFDAELELNYRKDGK